jgi:hypothetical protein
MIITENRNLTKIQSTVGNLVSITCGNKLELFNGQATRNFQIGIGFYRPASGDNQWAVIDTGIIGFSNNIFNIT